MDDIDSADATPAPGTLTRAVTLRARHDGWTPGKQHDFIQALAECACVNEAAAAVGMTARSAYRLRARPDASAFRQAWDIALDYAIRNLSDAAYGRALHGVATPVFYKGEQVGERRRYDERLTMFLLRYRDPVRYGAWLDSMEARRHPDGAAITLAYALNKVLDRAHGSGPDAPAANDKPDLDAALEPALANGPPPVEPAAAMELAGDDIRSQITNALRAANRQIEREQQEAADADADDWRQAHVTRTPRIRRL